MGGKAILFLVIGFSTLFLIMEKNIGTASGRAVDNMTNYYENMNAHNIAVSGANVGANQIFLDHNWTAGFSNVPFADGKYTVTVDILNTFKNIRRLTSVGYYDGYSDTVRVTFQPSSFSKFAYYSTSEGGNIYWVTGDTVWGPMHTQDKLLITGDPVFNGKVTSKKGIVEKGFSNPQFNAGYQSGVDMPIPGNGTANLKNMADNGGADFSGHDTVYLAFAGDSIKYKYSYGSNYTSALGSALAPNGAIFASGAVLRLQGTVKGQYSVGASQETKTVTTTTTNKNGKTKTKTTTQTIGGDIYLDGDVVYNTDPVSNPSSTDLLGIVAQNNVLITDNLANTSGIKIQAAIYAETGGFGAENYAKRPVSGTIDIRGGITQNTRLPVGTFKNSGKLNYIVSGFQKDYRYDDRLMLASPPGFPNTGLFEIVSWYE